MSTSGMHTNENRSPVPNAPKQRVGNTVFTPSEGRRALAAVSPNVKAHTPTTTPGLLRKPLAGSPLKRSLNSAMGEGEGLTYLKRRRLADHEILSDVGGAPYLPSQEGIVTAAQSYTPCVSLVDDAPSPTEPNTPSEEDASTQGSSAERKSFSSLINYDVSSQTSNILFPTNGNVTSSAELLRLRLRVAMYKVRTNQVNIPFSELRDEHQLEQSATQRAIEEAVAELRREARDVLARSSGPSYPTLLPGPLLQPTAYSSRMIYGRIPPSSPPTTRSPDKLPALTAATPLRDAWRFNSDQELTSSVVKGRVAEGLLGLRHAL